jgi:hypothetical protein
MGADLKQIRQEAQATVERYRQAGALLTDAQARAMELEVEQALIRAWAEHRVRQMASTQLAGPLKAVRNTFDKIVPAILHTVGS